MESKKFIKTTIREYLNEEREVFTKLYHGTDMKSAIDIQKYGVVIYNPNVLTLKRIIK
jgi:hypothetical protein